MLNYNIKLRRLNLGMTLGDLSEEIGLSKGTLSKYETGAITNIDTKTIMKLARILKCTPAQLMGWESLPQTNNKKLDELITYCYQLDDDKLDMIIDTVKTYKKVWNVHDL